MNPEDVDKVTRKKRQRSKVWAFFVHNPRTRKAVCCECNGEYNSDSNNNLKKHIVIKHPHLAKELAEMKEPIYAKDKVKIESKDPEGDDPETTVEDKDGFEMQEVEYLNEDDNIEVKKNNKRCSFRSNLWRFFKIHPRKPKAKCIGCNKKYQRESISNLKRHLERSHPKLFKEYKKMDQDPKYIPSILLSTKGGDVSALSENVGKINKPKRKSFIWQHYRVLNHSVACCNVCHKRISYKSSISNLKKHVIKRHPLVNLNEPPDYGNGSAYLDSPMQDDSFYEDDDNSFPDDAENIKTLLGLKGAQVDRTIEIIETDNNLDPVSYQNEEGEVDNYDDDNYENDLIVKPIRAKPILRSCLKSIKQEPNEDIEVPIKYLPEDPIDVLVKNIAYKLRIMSDKQRMIAEYKIHEILFLGMSEQLKLPHEENIAEAQKPDYSITVMDGQNPEEQIM